MLFLESGSTSSAVSLYQKQNQRYLRGMEQSTKQHAALDLTGATCTSCVIAIEHLGKRIKGISDIYVDRKTKSIEVEYDGNRQSLEKIQEFVHRIGYVATIRETEAADANSGSVEQ